MKHIPLPKTLLALLAILLLSACGSIPDTTPFQTATVSMRQALAGSYKATQAGLLDSADLLDAVAQTGDVTFPWPGPDGQLTELTLSDVAQIHREHANTVRERADNQLALIDAMVQYAGKLTAVASSASRENKKIEQTRQALEALANEAQQFSNHPAASTTAGVATAIANASATIQVQIVQAQALSNMGDLIEINQKQVGIIAENLAKDIASMNAYFDGLDMRLAAAFDLANQPLIDYRNSLLQARNNLQQRMDASLNAESDENDAAPNTLPPEMIAQVASLADSYRKSDVWLADYTARRGAILQVARQSRVLVADSAKAVKTWNKAHQDLADAVREARQPNVAAIRATVEAVDQQVKRVEDARKAYLLATQGQ